MPKKVTSTPESVVAANDVDDREDASLLTACIITQRSAKGLGLSEDKFKKLVREFKVPHVRSGDFIIVRASVFLAAIAKRETVPDLYLATEPTKPETTEQRTARVHGELNAQFGLVDAPDGLAG